MSLVMGHIPNRKTPISAFHVRKASVLATADPRTVRKVLRGEVVSPMAHERVIRALREMGLAHLVRDRVKP